MESPSSLAMLSYQSGGKRGSWLWRILIAVLVIAAGVSVWGLYGRAAWQNLQTLHWQKQCSNFQPLPGTYASTPICWANYRCALPADEPFMGGTQIFLHECTSPHGNKVLVALYMRPNMDHMQMCSIDATVVVPGNLSRRPVSNRHAVEWIPGWSEAVQWNKLKWAHLDPADPSHMIFKYDSPEPKWWGSENPDINDNTMVTTPITLDFWLQDDGQIVTHAPVLAAPP